MNTQTKRLEEELSQLRENAENSKFNIDQFGLDSYTPRQLHQWKEDFETGLMQIRNYSEQYMQTANDVPMSGVNARRAVLSCIDYLTQEIVSRGGRK